MAELNDVWDRCQKANDELITLANKTRATAKNQCDTAAWIAADRLIAKAEGVRLVMSYLREIEGVGVGRFV